MNKEEKQYLGEEIESVKKALRSIGYQYGFWQRKVSVDARDANMQQFRTITGQKKGTEEYLKYLEDMLAKG